MGMETWSACGALQPAKPPCITHVAKYNKAGYIKGQSFSGVYISWTPVKSIECFMLGDLSLKPRS